VARGFIPVRVRSARKTGLSGVSEKIRLPVLGLLRNPTGINPLATKVQPLVLRIEIIQRPIHRQLAKHDHLRYPQQSTALRPCQKRREITGHDTG
jgi:hypothetical protein